MNVTWNLPEKEITKKIDLFHLPNLTIEDIYKYFFEIKE